eukprot:431739-Pelagomonas_calceolata.AAC.3
MGCAKRKYKVVNGPPGKLCCAIAATSSPTPVEGPESCLWYRHHLSPRGKSRDSKDAGGAGGGATFFKDSSNEEMEEGEVETRSQCMTHTMICKNTETRKFRFFGADIANPQHSQERSWNYFGTSQ